MFPKMNSAWQGLVNIKLHIPRRFQDTGPVWTNMTAYHIRPRQNGRHFTDNTFKCISLNKDAWILIKMPLKFVPKGPNNNIPALVQIIAWRRPGAKPLSEPMMV